MSKPYIFQQKKQKRLLLFTNVRRTSADVLTDSSEVFCVFAPIRNNVQSFPYAPPVLPFKNTYFDTSSGFLSMPGIVTNVGSVTTFDPRMGTFRAGGDIWFIIDSNTLFRSICSFQIPWDSKTDYTMSVPFDLLANVDEIKFRSFRNPVTAAKINPSNANVHLYICGKNNYGQLGSVAASVTGRNTFFAISGNWTDAHAGYYGSYALSASKTLFATGDNSAGQLGLPSTSTCMQFMPVTAALDFNNGIVLNPQFDKISAGAYHAVALSGNRLFCTGSNAQCQLGTSKTTLCSSNVFFWYDSAVNNVPVEFDSVHCGGYFTYALSGKTPFRAGLNTQGQLGSGNFSQITHFSPVTSYVNDISIEILETPQFDQIQTGDSHVLALSGNQLFVTGSNDSGELGIASMPVNKFTQVNRYSLDGNNIVNACPQVDKIACGSSFSSFISAGRLFVTGQNKRGQLGLNDTNNRDVFTLVSNNAFYDSAACGYQYLLALSGNTLFGTGNNTNSEMSLPVFYRYLTLTPILTARSSIDKLATATSTTILSAPQGFDYVNKTTISGLTGWYYHRTPAFYAVNSTYYPAVYSLGYNLSATPVVGISSVFFASSNALYKGTNPRAYGSVIAVGAPHDHISISDPQYNAGSVLVANLSGLYNYRLKNIKSFAVMYPVSSALVDFTYLNTTDTGPFVTVSAFADARFGYQVTADEKYMYIAAPTLSGIIFDGPLSGTPVLSSGAIFGFFSPLTASNAVIQPVSIMRPNYPDTHFGMKMDCSYNSATKSSTIITKSLSSFYVIKSFATNYVLSGNWDDVTVVTNANVFPYSLSTLAAPVNKINTISLASDASYNMNVGAVLVNYEVYSAIDDHSYWLINPANLSNQSFGYSTHARGKYLAVGAPNATISGKLCAGRVDVFVLSGMGSNLSAVPQYYYQYSLSALYPVSGEQFGKQVHFDLNSGNQFLSGEYYMGDSLLVASNSGCYLHYRYGNNFLYTLSSAYANSVYEKSTLLSLVTGTISLGTVYQSIVD